MNRAQNIEDEFKVHLIDVQNDVLLHRMLTLRHVAGHPYEKATFGCTNRQYEIVHQTVVNTPKEVSDKLMNIEPSKDWICIKPCKTNPADERGIKNQKRVFLFKKVQHCPKQLRYDLFVRFGTTSFEAYEELICFREIKKVLLKLQRPSIEEECERVKLILEEERRYIRQLKEHRENLKRRLETANNDLLCSICVTERKNVVFVCGHTACRSCATLLYFRCHVCRRENVGFIPLHLQA